MKPRTILLICLVFVSCKKETIDLPFTIEGITMENYPKVDGSTSTDPLNRLMACKLLGYNYKWEQALVMNGLWYLSTEIPQEFVAERLKSSQTHNSIINLIDKQADLILSARKMSPDEKNYQRISGPVVHNSTGTSIQKIGNQLYCFSGSSERKIRIYTYPELKEAGVLNMDLPPWDKTSGTRVWPNVVQLPDGYPFKYVALMMDRFNYPTMKGPNWTYGAL